METLPTIHIIKQAVSRQRISPKIAQVLLMIVRMLLTVLLVCAFMKPVFSTTHASKLGKPTAEQISPDTSPTKTNKSAAKSASKRMHVLLITSGAHVPNTGSGYLQHAINPSLGNSGRTALQSIPLSEITTENTKKFDVLLMDMSQLRAEDSLPPLMHTVEEGKNLVLFAAGERSLAALKQIENNLTSSEQMPVTFKTGEAELNPGIGYLTIAEQNHDSLFLKKNLKLDWSGLRNIHIRKSFNLLDVQKSAEILLNFGDGTPAAVQGKFGNGEIVLCNFSPGREFGDLALSPAFPPLVHELISSMANKNSANPYPNSKPSVNITEPSNTTTDKLHIKIELWPYCIVVVMLLLLCEDILTAKRKKIPLPKIGRGMNLNNP